MPPFDVYDMHGDGDLFRLLIKGKLDNQKITVNGIDLSYSELKSFELVFLDDEPLRV